MASNSREESFIRQIVREELSTQSSICAQSSSTAVQSDPTSSPLGIVAASVMQRTRGLVEQLQQRNNNNRAASTPSNNQRPGSIQLPVRRRVTKRKYNQLKDDTPKRETKWVYVLEAWNEIYVTKFLDDYSFKDNLVQCKAQIEFLSTFSEDEVRNEIASVVKTRFPNLGPFDFHFVKRDRFTLSIPVVKEGHKWGYENVKQLCGQGILYVRLNKSKTSFVGESSVDKNQQDEEGDDVVISNVISSSGLPSTSGGGHPVSTIPSLFFQNNLSQLQDMFPGKTRQTLMNALNCSGSVEEAVGYLTGRYAEPGSVNDDNGIEVIERPSHISTVSSDEVKNVKSVLQYLWENHSEEKVKLRIDPEDIVQDAFAFYKSSAFDERCPLRVVYNGQPAADSGGVLRQFYTDVFKKVVENYFHGCDNKKLPIPSSDILMSGMMMILGKMIVHSLLQGGPGFPFLPLACYKYLATGDIANAAIEVDASDVASYPVKLCIQKLQEANTYTDLEEIINDNFFQLMEEAGETCSLSLSTKHKVMQSLIVYDVLTKRQPLLDQIRQGLKSCNFLNEMEKSPDLFTEVFVYEYAMESVESIETMVDLPEESDLDTPEKIETLHYLQRFLKTSGEKTLKEFLSFVTGTPNLPPLGLSSKIEIVLDMEANAFYASTCFLKLTLPCMFKSYNDFCEGFYAVFHAGKKAFTSI